MSARRGRARVREPSVGLRVEAHATINAVIAAARQAWGETADDRRRRFQARLVGGADALTRAVSSRIEAVERRPGRAAICVEYRVATSGGTLDVDALFDDAIAWVERRHGAGNVAGLVTDQDGAVRTLHVFVVPVEAVEPQVVQRPCFWGRGADGRPRRSMRPHTVPGYTQLPSVAAYRDDALAALEADFGEQVTRRHGCSTSVPMLVSALMTRAQALHSVVGDLGRAYA